MSDNKSIRKLETHILNLDRDSFDPKWARISFLSYLRSEQKFNDLLELKEQISKDVHAARDYFNM